MSDKEKSGKYPFDSCDYINLGKAILIIVGFFLVCCYFIKKYSKE